MIRKYLASALLLLTAAAGCVSEKVEMGTTIGIMPYVLAERGGERDTARMVVAHIFYADSSEYYVEDFDKALAGKISGKAVVGGGELSADFSATQDGAGALAMGPVVKRRFIMVVAYGDADYRMYAWRQAATAENIPRIDVKLEFQVYQQAARFKQANWNFVYENHPVPNN